MRIASNMMIASASRYLSKNGERLLELQETVSSGKKIRKPSDDPVGAVGIMDHRSAISGIDQTLRNIVSGKNRIEATETILGAVSDLIQQARKIAVDQSAGDSETREMAAEEIGEIRKQILQLANSRIGESYLFGGNKTGAAPFSSPDGNYQGDAGRMEILAGEGAVVRVNVSGGEIFSGVGTQGGVDVFRVLADLENALTGDSFDAAAVESLLDPLETAAGQVKNGRSIHAAAFKRFEAAENHWEGFRQKLEAMLTETEEADTARAVMALKLQETAYQTSLAATARVIQPSLIDFLR